jgi:hypothetical protein
MLMALAERADIDFIIERAEEGEEDEEESEQQSLGVLDNALGRMDIVQKDEDFPEDIEQRIQQQEAPQSLLGAR